MTPNAKEAFGVHIFAERSEALFWHLVKRMSIKNVIFVNLNTKKVVLIALIVLFHQFSIVSHSDDWIVVQNVKIKIQMKCEVYT